MEIVPLHWDSDFFGLRIAKAIVSSEKDVVALSRKEEDLQDRYDLIYIFSEPGLEILFEKARLVDRKAVYSLSTPVHFEVNPAITHWDSPITSDDLISLALVSGKYSRFKLDVSFPTGSYERLYTHWIKQSVNKTIATDVFCYMMDGRPLGLVTLDCRDGRNTIGLVAVDGDYQHHGIGTALVKHAVSYVYEHHGGRLSVTTQLDNKPACRMYIKCGFSLESIKNIWHWWL